MPDPTIYEPTTPPATPEPQINASPESFQPPPTNPTTPPAEPSPTEPKKSQRKWLYIILVIIVIAIAVIAYAIHAHNQSNSNGKKDIPYLTYGLLGSGNMAPTYPVDAANSTDALFIDAQLFEGLVRPQDQIKIAPALAVSWYNPNNTTWIFNLRHGVKFHSGRTMTATDVKYSLDYAVANQSEQDNSTLLSLASGINKVSIVNPYQVKITTNGPDAVLLNQLADLYIVDSKAKLGSPNAGTGPYTVKPGNSNSPTATTLGLVAFNSYWGGHVYTREVQFQEVPSQNQLVSDTAAGKFDISGDFDSQQSLTTIKAKVKYYRPIVIPDIGVSYLELNLEKAGSPLKSLAARQAIAYALNVPAVLKAGDLNATPVNQVIPQTLPGYDPSIKDTPYDPAKAKQLLSSVPNAAAPLTLYYATGDNAQVTAIASQLNAVGFNVKATAVNDFITFLNQVVSGQGDMFFLSYTTNTLDGLDMINNTVAGTANYTSPELNSLTNQANSTIDPTTRIAVLQKLEQLVASDIPTIALYTQVRTFALTKPYVINVNLPSVLSSTYLYQVYQK